MANLKIVTTAPDLRQDAGQIVDELKRESRNNQVERFRPDWERLGLKFRQIDPHGLTDAIQQRAPELIAWRTDVGRAFELAQHDPQPLRRVSGNAVEQKCCGFAEQGATLARAQQSAIEQRGRGIRGRNHGRVVRRCPQVWQSGCRNSAGETK